MRARASAGRGGNCSAITRLSGFVEVPVSACQSILDSVPEALVPTLHGARLTGTFGAMGRFAFDTAALDDLELVYRVDDHCHFAEVPRPLDRERFRKRFVQRIVRPDGEISEMEPAPTRPIGPRSSRSARSCPRPCSPPRTARSIVTTASTTRPSRARWWPT
ncbi:MAG: hypothetical protein U0235_13445 [Polyangiaceae bacterium]